MLSPSTIASSKKKRLKPYAMWRSVSKVKILYDIKLDYGKLRQANKKAPYEPGDQQSMPPKISWYHIISHHSMEPPSTRLPLLLLALLVSTAKHATNISAGALRSACHATDTTFHAIGCALSVSAQRTLTLNWFAVLVLATAFGTVDAFFRDCIAERLGDTAFTDGP